MPDVPWTGSTGVPGLPDVPADQAARSRLVLHALRHLEAFLGSLGLHLVIVDDPERPLVPRLCSSSRDVYDEATVEAEHRRHRRVLASEIVEVLDGEPSAVPLVYFGGMANHGILVRSWGRRSLHDVVRPGRLVATKWHAAHLAASGYGPLEVVAWQNPPPMQSLAWWGRAADFEPGRPIRLPFGSFTAAWLERGLGPRPEDDEPAVLSR